MRAFGRIRMYKLEQNLENQIKNYFRKKTKKIEISEKLNYLFNDKDVYFNGIGF